MNTGFHYHHLVEAIQKAGYPKAERARAQLLCDLDSWGETVLGSDEARAAAVRVGQDLFRAPHGLAAMFIAYRLQKKSRRAFSEFRVLVDLELQTRALEARDRVLTEEKDRTIAKKELMSAEKRAKDLKTFSRQEFYDLVWSTPARTLAANLGISDVMIGKICKKHGIPKPYLGYWAKYYAGQTPRRRPLPNDLKAMPVIVITAKAT